VRGTRRSAPRRPSASAPFEIDAADQSFADARGEGEILGHLISNEALVGVPTAIPTASFLIAIGGCAPENRFASDSLLEGTGSEPLVPLL
jgi:hypothetical protein